MGKMLHVYHVIETLLSAAHTVTVTGKKNRNRLCRMIFSKFL